MPKRLAVAPGRRDGTHNGGGPDPRDPSFPRGRTLASAPSGSVQEQEEILRIRSHDFHETSARATGTIERAVNVRREATALDVWSRSLMVRV